MSSLDEKIKDEPTPVRPKGKRYAIIDYFTGWYSFNDLINGDARKNGRFSKSVAGFGDGLLLSCLQIAIIYGNMSKSETEVTYYVLPIASIEGLRLTLKALDYFM